jgi:peptidyl-prolyl cis-trans isomerase D
MALVTKIREKSGIAIGIIAISMILFIVGGDLLSPNSKLLGGTKDVVGVIDGNEIGLDEFARKVEEVSNKYSLSLGRRPNDYEMDFIRQEAWNNLVNDIVMVKEFAKLGIEVSREEVRDMVQGNNIHPGIAQSFKDDKGNADVAKIKEFINNLRNAPVDQQMQFRNFESNLAPERLSQKYEKLLAYASYTTSLEAENEYNYQNNKVDIKFVVVPFNAIPDSTVQVTEAQLKEYFDANKSKYKVEANRGIEYVTFPFTASKEDSAAIQAELEDTARKFVATTDDTTFMAANSDDNNAKINSYRIGDLPGGLKYIAAADLIKSRVLGPFVEGNKYMLYKIVGMKEDSLYSMRASHILFGTKGKADTEKPAIRKKAEDVLAQIKKGQSFEGMAAIYGEDGTKNSGGDLNWFKEGMMVKPFNDAVLKAPVGLMPTLVETEFGYHIIKVTEAKTKQQYQIAALAREIVPSEKTRELSYKAASNFAKSKDAKEYQDAVKENKYLSLQALNIAADAKYVNNMQGSKVREIVKWAYKEETALGSISEVFDLDDAYIVALLRDKQEKGDAKLEDVKEMVTARVREELKAKMIIEKLADTSASLDDIAKKYGQGASVFTQEDINVFTLSLNGTGSATQTIGRACALPKGSKTKAYKDDNGVLILEVINTEEAPKIADHNTYRDQLTQRRSNGAQKYMKTIKKLTKTEDYISKYY